MNTVKILGFLTLYGFLFLSCQKDQINYQNNQIDVANVDVHKATIANLKRNLSKERIEGTSLLDQYEYLNDGTFLSPIWYLAREIEVNGAQIVSLPLNTGEKENEGDISAHLQLVYSINSDCGDTYEIISFLNEETITDIKNDDKCLPSGAMSLMNSCTCNTFFYLIEDGRISHIEEMDLRDISEDIDSTGSRDFFWDGWFDKIRCPGMGGKNKKNWFQRVWDKIKNIRGTPGNHTPPGGPSWGFPTYRNNTGSNGGSSGGGGSSYDSYESILYLYENGFFNGSGSNINRMLDELISNYNIQICISDLHKLLYECLNNVSNDPSLCLSSGILLPGDPDDVVDDTNSFLTINDYEDLLSKLTLDNVSCLNDIINNSRTDIELVKGDGDIICYLDEINFDADNATILDILNIQCGDDAVCRRNKMICVQKLKEFEEKYDLDLSASEEVLILENTSVCDGYFDEEALDKLCEQEDITDPEIIEIDNGCSESDFITTTKKVSIYKDCGCPLSGSEGELITYDSSNEFYEEEPKWGQLGNCYDIVLEVNSLAIVNSNPPAPILDQIRSISEHFDCSIMYMRDATGCVIPRPFVGDICGVTRYTYSKKVGWIDWNHVFEIFEWAADIYEQNITNFPTEATYFTNGIEIAANTAEHQGYMGELFQWAKGNYSGFSYEDLCSNHVGTTLFIASYLDLKDGNKSWVDAISELCSGLEIVEPIEAPNYGYIPHLLDDKYPKIFDHIHCLVGEELENAARAVFCKRTIKEQLKIMEAHADVPH